jgi:hypothetical protein
MAHKHNWVLVRTEHKHGHTYRFYECIAPGCPNPHKMKVD